MATSGADRQFFQGETVHLRARISKPGTKTPVDPTSVALTRLRRNGVVVALPAVTDYTRGAEGDYSLVVPTDALDPGAYDIVTTVSDGPQAVVLLPDQFVIQAI